MELVQVNQGFVCFSAVTGLSESSPSNLEFEGGSAIAAPTVGDDGLDDELLFVFLATTDGEIVDVGRGALATDEFLDHID